MVHSRDRCVLSPWAQHSTSVSCMKRLATTHGSLFASSTHRPNNSSVVIMAANIQIKRRTAKLFGVFSTYIKQKHLTSYLNLPECLSTKAFPLGRCFPKILFFFIPNSKPPEFSYGKPWVYPTQTPHVAVLLHYNRPAVPDIHTFPWLPRQPAALQVKPCTI